MTIPHAPTLTAQRGRAGLVAIGLALGALLVLAQGMQAWANWKRDTGAIAPSAVAAGALSSVMLINGQIYYGEFVDANPRYVSLRNVYYVQTVAVPPGSQPANRLVSRRKADWHAPTLMSIPADKVMMIEAVGPASRLAELIKQDQAANPAE